MGWPGYVTPPIFVVLATIAYTTVAVAGCLGLATAAGVANAAAFMALTAICLATYAAAASPDPGMVLPAYLPDVEDAEIPVHKVKCKDHHCIWINNSVGHENYKIFLVFVLYALIACFYSMCSES
uniref:Uncharacterized protein n=1 Tax=Avena sativa TaxID=4498 RepID=A0ACD5U6M9_AVESA